MSKNKYNSVRRSMARGSGARGTTGLNNNGVDAYKQARKSLKGHYRIAFTQVYEGMTEKDIELRQTYAKDLVAGYVGVPIDMIHLRPKKKTGEQTLTALDEVYYVKVGQDNYGKLSIRTQRLWKGSNLIFVFQEKKNAYKPPQKSFSRNRGFGKRSASRKAQTSRNSYNNRRGGTY